MKKIFYILVLTLNFTYSQSNNVLFEQANSLYNDGKVQDAISKYEQIINSGYHSAELYYNLGNAYYKLNKIAPTIYYYEKALRLSPKDEEVKNNLSFAKNMTIDAIDPVPELGFSRIVKTITNLFSYDSWAKLSVSFVVIFVVFFLFYFFSMSTLRKRFTFLTAFTSLFIAILAFGMAFKKYDYDKNDKPAIVFAQESEVRTEPNLRSENAFQLHEGTKVMILETYEDNWTKIKIANGKTGWISREDIKPL